MEESAELSLEQTKSLLISLRHDSANLVGKNKDKFLKAINALLMKINALEMSMLVGIDSLNDRILLGSFVELELDYGDGDIEETGYYLGLEYSDNSISILSPIGQSIFCKSVGENEVCLINNQPVKISIISKTNNNELGVKQKRLN